MKIILTFLSLSLMMISSISAQNSVNISGNLSSCDLDTLLFFELDGSGLRPVAKIPLTRKDNFIGFGLEVKDLPKGFYLIGGGQPTNTLMMILGDEPKISISGECKTFNKAQITNSEDNYSYQAAMKKSEEMARKFNGLINQYRLSKRDPVALKGVDARMANLDKEKINLLNSLKEKDPFVAKAIALRTYLSYQHNKKDNQSEAQYFGESFFQFVDFSDPLYNRMPLVHDNFRSFANTITRVGLTSEKQMVYTSQWLDKIPEGSRTKKLALLGLITGFRGQNEDAFVKYAETYLTNFPNQNPGLENQLKKQVEAARSKMIGSVAPEISLPTPEGDTLNLSDFRGKVLLVDFWASWCGPCRRENPHVKKLYEKYKDQGFEILGVSLDRTKASWVAAIEKDGLPWPHISDLKHWRSVAAKTYGVGAIPYTLLLDREGRIVAKKLRGINLERKIAELLETE